MKVLERTLGLPYVVAISIGAMLGAGIFVLPGLAAGITGPSMWLAFLAAAVCVLPAVLSKAEMATAMPTSGGTYVYLDRAFGPLAGTISGLGLWLSLLMKSAFTLVGFGAYLSVIRSDLPLKPTALTFLGIIVVLNLVGVRKVGKSLLYVVLVAIVGLVALVAGGVTSVDPVAPVRFFSEGMGGFVAATAFVFVSFAGVTKVAAVAEEVKDPGRNLPLGMILSLTCVAVIYAAVGLLLVERVEPVELHDNVRPIFLLARSVWGATAGVVFAVIAVLTLAAGANVGVLAASRFPFAMARDRLVPGVVAHVHARFMTPTVSILATAGVMAVAIAFLDVEGMAKLASSFKILIFILVNVTVIVLRESGVQWYRPLYRSPLYPAVQIFGILSGVGLLIAMGPVAPLAIGAMAVPGVALYFVYGRRRTERTSVWSKFTRRPELISGAVEAVADDAEPGLPTGECAVTVALFGWERSAEGLVEVGGALALGRPVEVVHLDEAPDLLPVARDLAEDPGIRSLRRRVHALAEDQGLDVHFDAVVSRDLVKAAHDISKRLHCAWLVMAWRGRKSRHRFLFLNPLGWLTSHLQCNLALFRDSGVRYYRKILAYVRPGPDDLLVTTTSDHLAELYGARLVFARFVPDDTPDEELQSTCDYIDQMRGLCNRETERVIVRGTDPVSTLVELTASYDLLVTSAHIERSVVDGMRGSRADRLKEQAACSVLSVRTPLGRTHDRMFGRGIAPSKTTAGFSLLDHVEPRCMQPRIDVARKDVLFTHVAGAYAQVLPEMPAAEIADALWIREKKQNTSIGRGAVLPHASLTSTDRAYVGVFTCTSPIDYHASDGEPVDVVFSTIGPPADRQTHLLILSSIATLLEKTPVLDRLREAGSAEEMRAALAQSLSELNGPQAAAD